MPGLKTLEANDVLNRTLGVSPSATRQVRLYTTAPTAAANGTEVSGGSYAPQTVVFTTASGGASENSATVTFPAATGGGWGSVVAWAVTDAGGTQKTFRAITPITVNDGDVVRFQSGDLDVTLA